MHLRVRPQRRDVAEPALRDPLTRGGQHRLGDVDPDDLAGTGVTANVLVPGGMTDTRIIADGAVADRSRLLRPEIMAPPLLWLVSDAAAEVTGRRFLAVHWDTTLPPAEAAEKCGAPIAWKSIATMPIEPDWGSHRT